MSVYDDGEDIGPAVETRGGEDIDWDATKPGKPLKEKPDTLPPDLKPGDRIRLHAEGSWETGEWAGEE